MPTNDVLADLLDARGTAGHVKTLTRARDLAERTGQPIVVYAERSRAGEIVFGFMAETVWHRGSGDVSWSHALLDTIRPS